MIENVPNHWSASGPGASGGVVCRASIDAMMRNARTAEHVTRLRTQVSSAESRIMLDAL
jgi:hypothetical protein